MMHDDVRAERVKKYGSFLYCPERDTICSLRDNDYGVCPKEDCILDDPEYMALQKKIELRRAWNQQEEERRQKREAREPVNSPSGPNKDKEIINLISAKEAQAKRAFEENKPKRGSELLHEAHYLRCEYKKEMRHRYEK